MTRIPQGGDSVIAQVRIYTINKGMMDSWVKLFNEQLAPLHARYGITILGAWVNRGQNEFVWIRTFEDEADVEAKSATYYSSPERTAIGDLPGQHIAKIEVRTVESVFQPVAAPV
jgi:hypothetical protein